MGIGPLTVGFEALPEFDFIGNARRRRQRRRRQGRQRDSAELTSSIRAPQPGRRAGNEIACNDDAGGGALARVTFTATEEQSYWIRLVSFALPGDYELIISCGGAAGDIDVFDHACYLECVSGPGGGVMNGCEVLDLDWIVTTT